MRFYNRQHRHYCGIDLHVKTMYVCILDATGQVLVHRNVKSTPEAFLEAVAPYRGRFGGRGRVHVHLVLARDVCAAEGIAFVLGHALAMKAIHGGKAKNDKLDSFKIASLLRGGLLPQAYVYPASMRATNLYQIHDITRVGRVQEFASYARLVKGQKQSAGKTLRTSGAKMGNVHLKWAFSEAAVLFLRHTKDAKKFLAAIEQKHGNGKALSILAHKIGRAVFYLLSRGTVFSPEKFLAA